MPISVQAIILAEVYIRRMPIKATKASFSLSEKYHEVSGTRIVATGAIRVANAPTGHSPS